MTPKTIDWDMFLGHEFDVDGVKLGPTPKEMPFDRAVLAQWRCYWPFGGGMFTDLFVHQTTHLISAMGVRYPAPRRRRRRPLPRVRRPATCRTWRRSCADYDEGCQMFITGHDVQRLPSSTK